jgi:hypothetical protein
VGGSETYICRSVNSTSDRTGFAEVKLEKMDGSSILLQVRNATPYRPGARYNVIIRENK